MLERLRAWLFKREAEKLIRQKKTAECICCDDPILPGDFVGVGILKKNPKREGLIHAGFHRTLNKPDAFCETGAIGIGFWDGERVVKVGESAASKTMRTGQISTF